MKRLLFLSPEEVAIRESNRESVHSLLKEESWEGAMLVELTGARAVAGWLLCILVLVLQS